MSNIKQNFKVSAKGTLFIDNDGRMILSVEDEGDYDLAKVFECFDRKEIKIQVTYDEDYGTEVDENTGEIVE